MYVHAMDVRIATPSEGERDAGAPWAPLLIGACSLLVMTIRFPPTDLTGWLASSLQVPIQIILLGCTALCLAGYLIARKTDSRAGVTLNSIVGTLALASALTSTISILIN